MTRQIHGILCGLALGSIAAVAAPLAAEAHGHRPPWLDATTLDHGLYVAVQHPRVIRATGPVDIKVIVRNVAGPDDVTVKSVRYVSATGEVAALHRVNRALSTRRDTLDAYLTTLEKMHDAELRRDAAGRERLAQRVRALLQELAAEVLVDRHQVPAEIVPAVGSQIRYTVEIELVDDGVGRVIRRPIEIPVQPPLPTGMEAARRWRYDLSTGLLQAGQAPAPSSARVDEPVWHAGDQHLHTTYSLDALVLDGTEEDVIDYATTAELIGLDWIIITDHSNVHVTWSGTEYYTPEQFAEGTIQAAAYTSQHPLLTLYGEEMGAGQAGFWNLPSHYLAYPFASDSTGYLANPSSGLIFGLANCEPEQVIIDRVNDAGGFGFIAHPFDSGDLAFVEWDFDNGVTGWSGLEIWSDTLGQIKTTDDQALAKWHDLLNTIPAPQQGMLGDRPDYPSTFPVGLGNSDAHEPGLIGATFTYAWMSAVSRTQVVGALVGGHCVASNGPLMFGEVNGARIGEVAFLLDGDSDLDMTLATTTEFGPVGDYELTVHVNGLVRATVPPTGDPGYSMTIQLAGLDLSPPDKFVTLRADSLSGLLHAITNPIWLQFTGPGDADADGLITLTDFQAFGECTTGPEDERLPSCDIMDFNRDRDVDLADFAAFQVAFTGA